MSLELKKLEEKLDLALANETSETLTKFLSDKTIRNNKQSSVDILFEDLFNSFEKFNNGKFCLSEYMAHNLKVLEQAKAMHKEEIEEAYWEGGEDVPMSGRQCTQYYNDTYGGNK